MSWWEIYREELMFGSINNCEIGVSSGNPIILGTGLLYLIISLILERLGE